MFVEIVRKTLELLGIIKKYNTQKAPQIILNAEPTAIVKQEQLFIENESSLQQENIKDKENFYEQPQVYPICIRAGISGTPQFEENIQRNDKGVLEDYFFDYARPILGGEFKNNVSVILPDTKLTPDFAYINAITNQFLIVEVDEPYSINAENELVPIHYKGIDDRRNEILLLNGWSVIRFAEEQVAKFPKDCVSYISDFIDEVESSTLIEQKCWSCEEAQVMIENKFRNTYLPFVFSEQTKRNNNNNNSYRHFDFSIIKGVNARDNGEELIVVELELNKVRLGPGEYRYDPKPCYIPEELFWNRVKELKMDMQLRSKMVKHNNCRYQIYIPNMMFEGYGRLTDSSFRLRDNDKFILSMNEPTVKRRPEKLTKDQINALRIMGININDEGTGLN